MTQPNIGCEECGCQWDGHCPPPDTRPAAPDGSALVQAATNLLSWMRLGTLATEGERKLVEALEDALDPALTTQKAAGVERICAECGEYHGIEPCSVITAKPSASDAGMREADAEWTGRINAVLKLANGGRAESAAKAAIELRDAILTALTAAKAPADEAVCETCGKVEATDWHAARFPGGHPFKPKAAPQADSAGLAKDLDNALGTFADDIPKELYHRLDRILAALRANLPADGGK